MAPTDIDQDILVATIVSSEGNIPLVAEKLTQSLHSKVTEYDVITALTASASMAKSVTEQLRVLLTVKLFDLLTNTHNQVLSSIDEVAPKDIIRMHASLLTAFSTLTAPAVKVTFDLDTEAERAAAEFAGITKEDVKRELKDVLAAANGKR